MSVKSNNIIGDPLETDMRLIGDIRDYSWFPLSVLFILYLFHDISFFHVHLSYLKHSARGPRPFFLGDSALALDGQHSFLQ